MEPILVVGSVALDTVETPFGRVKNVLGGSATYFSVSASFFVPVRVVAVVGNDFPQKYINQIKKRNIDLRGLMRQKGKTFRWGGRYDYNLNEAHTVFTQLNVFESFVPEIPMDYIDTPYVFLANIDPDLQLDVLGKLKSPRLVACDTMNYWIDSKKQQIKNVLKKVDILLINEAETRQLAEEFNLVKAARRIISWGPKAIIIKRGEHGCIYFGRDSMFAAPSYPLEKVFDPTGAGDSFAGGFAGYLAMKGKLNDNNIRQAIIFGSVMGSFCVERFSLNQLMNITTDEIVKRYCEIKNLTHFGNIRQL